MPRVTSSLPVPRRSNPALSPARPSLSDLLNISIPVIVVLAVSLKPIISTFRSFSKLSPFDSPSCGVTPGRFRVLARASLHQNYRHGPASQHTKLDHYEFFEGKGLEPTAARSHLLSAAAWSRLSKTVVWSPLANTNRPVHGRPSKRMAGSRSEAQPPGAQNGGTENYGNTMDESCKDLR